MKPRKSGASDLLIRSADGGSSWTAVETGLDGSVINLLVGDPANPDIVYGATNGRVFRSTNRGINWTATGSGLLGSIKDVAPSRSGNGVLYAATTAGVFRTADSGGTWTRVNTTPATTVCVITANGDSAYAGTGTNLIRTSNSGGAWSPAFTVGNQINDIYVDPRNTAIAMVAGNNGVFRTSSDGAAWTQVAVGFSQILAAPSAPDTIWLFSLGTLSRSTDNGLTFVARTVSPATVALAYAVDAVSPNTVYVGSEWQGFFKSTDGASTWSVVNPDYGEYGGSALLSISGGFLLAAATPASDAFAMKFTPAGTLAYSTYIGGTLSDTGYDIAVGPGGAWVTGIAYFGMPVTSETLGAALRGFDAFIVKLSETNPPCGYQIQAYLQNEPATGTLNLLSVLSGSGCAWTATSSVPWMRFANNPANVGTANVTYLIDPNPGPSRSGVITIGDKQLTIQQSGISCTYALNPTKVNVPAEGGDFPVSLTTGAGCPWFATSSLAWIQPRTTQGSSSASITVRILPNAGGARANIAQIGDQVVEFDQAGFACSVTPSFTSSTVPAAGGTGSVLVTAAGTCAYNISSNVAWLRATSAAAATGTTTVTWIADANPGAGRSGILTIGNTTVTVSQPATTVAGCTSTTSVASLILASTGQKGSFTLTTSAPTCVWTLQSAPKWAQFLPSSGTGDATITYTIYPNNQPRTRTATIFFPGASLNLSQSGSSLPLLERFVSQVYFNFLGRIPSPAEVAFHANNLNTIQTRDGLVTNFYNSAEFNQSGRFVAGLYLGILGRDAEFNGWLFQRNALSTGFFTQDQLVANYLGSAEFTIKYGNPSNDDFIRLIYRNILLREASPAEVTFQSGTLATQTRVAVARNFLNSAEFQQKLGPRMTAFLLYSALLNRDASISEIDGVANALIANPASIANLISSFTFSAEFNASIE